MVLQPLLSIASELIGLLPNENKRAEFAAQIQQIELQLAKGQLEVNANEAKSTSWFVAGWRPAVGWLCVFGLGYNTIMSPMFGFPSGDFEVLVTLLFGMLGLGGLRTFEKFKGVAR
jgi:hypothetical protein